MTDDQIAEVARQLNDYTEKEQRIIREELHFRGMGEPPATKRPINESRSPVVNKYANERHCQNCGTQLQDANIRFCSSCGSQGAHPQGTVGSATPDVSVVKAKLKPPAVAMMVNAGISLVICLYVLTQPKSPPVYYRSPEQVIALSTLLTLAFPALAFSIYSGLQMMNARKHGFAITSAIITILSGFFPVAILIGIPIGIWALIVLSKREIRNTFEN